MVMVLLQPPPLMLGMGHTTVCHPCCTYHTHNSLLSLLHVWSPGLNSVCGGLLLQSMLAADPTKRPSAEELLKQVAKCSSKSGLAVASSCNRRSL